MQGAKSISKNFRFYKVWQKYITKCDGHWNNKGPVKDITQNDMTTIKAFWDIVKPFVTNTSIATNDNIAIEAEKMEKLKLKVLINPFS